MSTSQKLRHSARFIVNIERAVVIVILVLLALFVISFLINHIDANAQTESVAQTLFNLRA